MKRILLFAAFAVISLQAFTQNKSIVGKWKLSTLSSSETHFNVEDPAQMKAELKKQFEASGQPADAEMLEMIFKSVFEALSSMTFDFGVNGKLLINTTEEGNTKTEEETYTVNYDKGVILSKAKEKEQQMDFKFENEKLVLTLIEPNGKPTIMTLKRIK